ncbi:hypothetical protein QOZ80_2BG0160550 [Eleusine coracana subsp. coracana]|nr:hypothetical protein QOZ80_2BG0160550 [Eleusine coracana subsp. coracana]
MEMPPPPPPFGRYPAAGGGGGKPDRKTVERNRRNQMNALYSRLDTLVRGDDDAAGQAGGGGGVHKAAGGEGGEAQERKRELTSSQGSGSSASRAEVEVEVQHLGSGLHAILVTGAPPSDGASFHRAVRAVEEAGGEVQNAHFSVVGARAIYTIHTLVSRRSAHR